MRVSLRGLGGGAVHWIWRMLGQVTISFAGTACLALLSNLYFIGPSATDANADTVPFKFSSASIASESFAPDPPFLERAPPLPWQRPPSSSQNRRCVMPR